MSTKTHTHTWSVATSAVTRNHTHSLGDLLTPETLNDIEARLDAAHDRLDEEAESRVPLYCAVAGIGAALVASPRKFSRRALFGLGRRR